MTARSRILACIALLLCTSLPAYGAATVRERFSGQQAQTASRTKRVAGEDLPASAFAYVGDPGNPKTWKLPLEFSTEDKTRAHIRSALARFSQTTIPEGERPAVRSRIEAAARRHGITLHAKDPK